MASKIEINNRKAEFLYELTDTFVAGIMLKGTEIKSIRLGRASLNEAFCVFLEGAIWVKMHIAEYPYGTNNNHDPRHDRKLLLKRHELKKLENKLKTKGITIIPTRMFIADNGYAKLEIRLARGKHKFDNANPLNKKTINAKWTAL